MAFLLVRIGLKLFEQKRRNARTTAGMLTGLIIRLCSSSSFETDHNPTRVTLKGLSHLSICWVANGASFHDYGITSISHFFFWAPMTKWALFLGIFLQGLTPWAVNGLVALSFRVADGSGAV